MSSKKKKKTNKKINKKKNKYDKTQLLMQPLLLKQKKIHTTNLSYLYEFNDETQEAWWKTYAMQQLKKKKELQLNYRFHCKIYLL